MTYSRCLLRGATALAALAPLGLASCKGPTEAIPAAAISPTAPANLVAASPRAVTVKAAAKTPAAPAAPPDGLGASLSGFNVALQDPKMPGRPLVKIWAGSMSGSFNGQGVQGTINGVSATLFQRGVAAAKLTAPTVRGDNMQDVLVATGRVTVVSLQQPGTLMRADRMTWYPKKNKVFADGNVYYRDGKYGATMNAPHIIADTFLKKIVVPSALRGNLR